MLPARSHPFTSGDGTIRSYQNVTSLQCPICNEHGQRANGIFGVLSDNDGTVTLECLNCAHNEHHDSRDFHARERLGLFHYVTEDEVTEP